MKRLLLLLSLAACKGPVPEPVPTPGPTPPGPVTELDAGIYVMPDGEELNCSSAKLLECGWTVVCKGATYTCIPEVIKK